MAAPLGGFARALQPLPIVALIAWAAHPFSVPRPRDVDRSAALASAVAAHGLSVQARTVRWLDEPSGFFDSLFSRPRAVFVAQYGTGRSDIWLARSRLAPSGRLIDVVGVYNITRTSAVHERELTVNGARAAWVVAGRDTVYRVELADFGGEAAAETRQWSRLARNQHAVTNWQSYGQAEGIARRSFRLDPAAKRVSLTLDPHGLTIAADDARIGIPHRQGQRISGERFAQETPRETGQPGNLITWAVDRARQAEWFGDERLQLVKAVAYAGLDIADRLWGAVSRDDSAEQIAHELGGVELDRLPEYDAPEISWPPPPLELVLPNPIPGEGRWFPLDNDPFVRTNPGAPPAFVTSFVRTDADREHSRIFVTLWDPRQVDLFMVPGTEEPQTATGETGSGKLPRDEKILSRLVAAFNGAFQSTHGDFGMMVDGAVIVPPKPYAATVARLEDGSVGFGTWPESEAVDPSVVAFRQNLTPLVVDGEINPYERVWWGGIPPDWDDETRTVRSGLCLTREGYVAYFYAAKVDHVHLGKAMQSARCAYGLHLDMNQGHTGLEFYRVDREAELAPLPFRPDPVWQYEAPVPDMPGWRFRSRRMITTTQLQGFPRYIRRSQRDFFYLTLKHVLPGHDLPVSGAAVGGEGKWTVTGLPQHGWPYALATTWLRPDPSRPEAKVRIVKVDPAAVRPATSARTESPIVVSLEPEAPADVPRAALYFDAGHFAIRTQPAPAGQLLAGSPDAGPNTLAAAGIDGDGVLVYAEVTTAAERGRDGVLLARALQASGCAPPFVFFGSVGRIALGGVTDLSGHPVSVNPQAVHLVRVARPAARRVFESTPVVARRKWLPLQQQTRFFESLGPDEASGSSGSPPPSLSIQTVSAKPPDTRQLE